MQAMIKILTDIWVFFDGKKTVIGGFLIWLCATPYLAKYIGNEVIEIIYYVGSGLLYGGGVHKMFKRTKK